MVNKSIQFSSTSQPQLYDYFKIEYLGKKLNVEDFYEKYKDNIGDILELSIICYKGKNFTYKEYNDFCYTYYKRLNDSRIYIDNLIKIETSLFLKNIDLFRGSRFIKKSEDCLLIGSISSKSI